MQLRSVERNLVTHETGEIHWQDVSDCFFQTEGLWQYRKDEQTGHFWLDPRPDDCDIGKIYQTYYTHADNGIAPAAPQGIWNRSVNAALHRRLGYQPLHKVDLLGQVISRFPTVADAAVMDVLKVPASATGRMLDVGCGSGAFLKKMRDHGWEVTGMEPDQKAAARITNENGIPVFQSIEDVCESQPHAFDMIVLSHVIEHLPDPVASLRDLTKLLAPSGKLIVTTPNAASLGARIFGRYWRGLEPPRHFNVFTPASLKLAFEAAGLTMQNSSTEVRMARGIWYLSYLAQRGHRELEIRRDSNHTVVKVFGYLFQLIEAAVVKFAPEMGEELYAVGSPK